MTPQEFVEKWSRANLSERSAYQQHFLDLCDLLNQPKPATADPDGAWYTFERGVQKTAGGNGWADVWMRGHFGWEYKGKHKNLATAYQQLLLYREDLENPPLLVVCDLDRFEIHTNFTGTAKKVYAFDLAGLTKPENLDTLRKLFTDPQALRPGQTAIGITEETANLFGKIADGMRVRGIPAHDAAHFLMKLMFCMFAEDIDLLEDDVFAATLKGAKSDPQKLSARLRSLFDAMATGGDFGPIPIPYFNGGLFSDNEVFDLTSVEIEELIAVNGYDWSSVEPSIFGTLFERTLDPDKRAQIGAHYTSRADIETLLQPVVMMPLRREWDAVRAKCDKLWDKIKGEQRAPRMTGSKKVSKERKQHDNALRDFVEHLAHIRILDPACGSGNFLYVAINLLLDLEKEVVAYGATHGTSLLPQVRPTQLSGIEINPYAQQLAQVVIWIGYLQWMHHNGFNAPRDPILEPIESITLMDAILDLSDPDHPKEPKWPKADFIVGNPPFLGDKKLRGGLGDQYVEALRSLYAGRVPGGADLVCYWFEKARDLIARQSAVRAGLLATQSIRVGANRQSLIRVNDSGRIFAAWSDRPWVVDGAAVRVSMVAFDDGREQIRTLDDQQVSHINADLTSTIDLTRSRTLSANSDRAFVGSQKGGAFDITEAQAIALLGSGGNPNGRPNSDVIRPSANGVDLTRRPRRMFIIDFGVDCHEETAAMYEAPFQYLARHVLPKKKLSREMRDRAKWWLHTRSRPAMRTALMHHSRYLATPRVAKYRTFSWLDCCTMPDSRLFVFAVSDDASMGILHSRIHEKWSLATSPRHGVGNDPTYNAMSCFETFPFPNSNKSVDRAISEAAQELDMLRNNWLNPPEWTHEETLDFSGSVDGPWARYVVEPDARGIGTVRYPRLVPKDETAAKALAKRTLTNLYNERPTWLDLAHKRLDEAVFAAYGWSPDISDDELLAKLLALNLERAAAESKTGLHSLRTL